MLEVVPAGQGSTRLAYAAFLDQLPVRRPRRILFINIPQVPADVFNHDTAKMNGYHIYPPVGSLYLAAAARLADPEIELAVLDLNYEMLKCCHLGLLDTGIADFWKELVEAEIAPHRDLHVAVGNMFDATTPMFHRITRFIRDTFPRVTLLTGGVQTTLDYQEVLENDYAHAVFLNEAEADFQRFLESCRGACPDQVPGGVAFKVGGKIYGGDTCRAPIREFLDIRPYYDLIDVENYYKYGGVNPYSRYVGKEKPFGTLLSNRGCRASCTFCGVGGFNGEGVRRRSARSVVDEIKHLVEHKGIRLIEWLDDDLLYGRKESAELFKLMAEELPKDVEWIANNGVIAGAVNEEIMYWMARSNCRAFKVGIESGNETLLRKIKKPASKASLKRAGELFNKYPGIFVSANFILGFPGETIGELLDTFHFANELSWDWNNYYICQPLPGTGVFDAFAQLGDDRCGKDGVGVYNPGKSAAQKGNFGYYKGYHSDDEASRSIASGRAVLDLPRDLVPSLEQVKEIWFTFNLVTNSFNNKNFKPGGRPEKIVRWFESIHASYPRDAGNCAMLAHGYRLLNQLEKANEFRRKFYALLDTYDYWKRRVEEFPELLTYAG